MRGRPRLPNVARRGDGKSLGPEGIHPETLAARERQLAADGIFLTFGKMELGREITKRTADDRLSGFALGRLLLRTRQSQGNPHGISEAQFEAGEAWGQLVRRHAQIYGYVVTPPTIQMESVSHSANSGSTHEIGPLREKWRACDKAIAEKGARAKTILWGIILENWPLASLRDDDYGLLRETLNAVGRILR